MTDKKNTASKSNLAKANATKEKENKTPDIDTKKDDETQVVKSPLRKKNVFHKGRGGKGGRRPRTKPEFLQKIVNISRVTRVVKGGRRLSFRVDMVIGDKNGRVGIGSGKAGDITIAIEKAYNKAKKKLITLGLTDTKSIPHEISAKYCASKVKIRPNGGRGLVAGSTVRNILEIAGITDVTAKVISRSENKLNNAKAAFKAVNEFRIADRKKEEKKSVNGEKEITSPEPHSINKK